MKTSTCSIWFPAMRGWAALLLLGSVWEQQTAAAEGSALPAPASRPEVVSTVSNSFGAVTAHLDPGGSLYFYLSTESWLNGLSSKVWDWRQLLLSFPGMGDPERARISQAFKLASGLVKQSGLEEISGVGLSGIVRENDLYRTRMIVHHYPDRNQGFLWSLCGTSPHRLKALDFLPANTVLAVGCDFDLALLMGAVEREIQKADASEAAAALEQMKKLIQGQTGVEFDQIVGSLTGPFLFLLTLDENKKASIPQPGGMLEIPEPRVGLMIKVKDETLFGIVAKPFQEQEQVIKVDKPGLKMRTLPLPLPVPVRATIAQTEEYFIVTTQDSLVDEMLASGQGQSPGLAATEEFKQLSKEIPLEGNQFSYVSRRFGREVGRAFRSIVQAQAGEGGPPAELLQTLMGGEKVTFGVTRNTPEGWLTTANGNEHPGMMLAGPALVAPTAIMAGMLLPALAKAKSRAQSISCVSNLKQICLGARMYANDHDDVFPMTFLDMKLELNSPKILVCPADNKERAADWSQFDPDKNLSYEFVEPGAKEDKPDLVVFRCPIHGHVGRADGSVEMGQGRR